MSSTTKPREVRSFYSGTDTLYLDPSFAIAHFALGNLACKRGQRKESGKHFENTLNALASYQQCTIVPESGGLTAGRVRELIAQRTNFAL